MDGDVRVNSADFEAIKYDHSVLNLSGGYENALL